MFAFGKTSQARIDTLVVPMRKVLHRAMSWQIMDFSVISARRLQAEQRALYAQGRKSVAEVNALRAKAGMPAIADHENIVVTWTMQSNHLANDEGLGEACDCAPYPYDPNATRLFWMLQGILLSAAAVEGVPVRSGADFNQDKIFGNDRTIDLPHIEYCG